MMLSELLYPKAHMKFSTKTTYTQPTHGGQQSVESVQAPKIVHKMLFTILIQGLNCNEVGLVG